MRTKLKFASFMIVAATLTLAACQPDESEVTEETEVTKETEETKEAVTEEAANRDFPTFGYDLGLIRHVPYDEISKENVKDLGLVWSKKFKELNPDIPNGNQNLSCDC